MAVSGNGDYTASASVKVIGWYNWTAQYLPDGDTNNEASTVHGCGVDKEILQITPRQPTVVTDIDGVDAGGSVVVGAAGTTISDTATLSGGTTDPKVTGIIRFKLYYSATDPTGNSTYCADATAIETVDVAVDGQR